MGKWGAAGRNKCRDVFAVWSSNVWGSTLAQWTTADLLLNISRYVFYDFEIPPRYA